MSSVTVSPKFQVVIPKDVRDKMRLAPGREPPRLVRLARVETGAAVPGAALTRGINERRTKP